MITSDPDLSNDTLVAEYIGIFAARDDLYVENGAEVRRQELGPAVIRKALKHRYAVSAYTGDSIGRTQVGAIDFDTEDGLNQAHQVREVLDGKDIPSMVVQSRRGAHLWVTSWDWTNTGIMHRMLTAAVGLALGNEAMGNDKIEVFPKVGTDLAVGALRLPGLPHQKTQQVYPVWFVDGTKHESATLRQIIEGHMLTTPEAVSRLASSGPRKTRYPKALGNFYGWKAPTVYAETPMASEVLADKWGVQVRPGGTVRCPKHQDRHRSLTVFKDDERVYCGAPHCPLNGEGHGVGSVQLSQMDA